MTNVSSNRRHKIIEGNFSVGNSMLDFIKKEQKKNNFRNNIFNFKELLKNKKYAEMIIFLQSLDDDTYRDAYGNTPLILCSKYNVPYKYLTEIINLNIDINTSNDDGERAFNFVKNLDDIMFYTNNSADIDYFNKDKNHIIFELLKKDIDFQSFVLLSKKLNYASIYDANNNTLLDTELSQLARKEFINFFIKMDVDVQNISNKTNVLMKLIINLSKKNIQKNQLKEYEHIFSLLLQKKANPNFIYELNDDIQIPLLSYIASLNDIYINFIKIMVTYGCDYKALSSTNKTAIEYARVANHTKTLRYLQKNDIPLMTKIIKNILFKKPLKINYPLKIVELKKIFLSDSNKVSEELYKSVLLELRDINFNIKIYHNEYDDFNLGEYEFYLQKARERNFPLMMQIMLDNSEVINNGQGALVGLKSGRIYTIEDKINTLISISFEEDEEILKEYLQIYLRIIINETELIKSLSSFSDDNDYILTMDFNINMNDSLEKIINAAIYNKLDLLYTLQMNAEFDTVREEFSLIESFIGKFYHLKPVQYLLNESNLNLTDKFWNKFKNKFKLIYSYFIGTGKDHFQLNYGVKESHISVLKETDIYVLFQLLKLDWKAFIINNCIIIENEVLQSESNFSESEFELLSKISDGQLNEKDIDSIDIIRSFSSTGNYIDHEFDKTVKIDNYLKKSKKIPVYTKYIMYTNAGIVCASKENDRIESLVEDNLHVFLLLTEAFSKHVAFYCFGEQTNIDIINKYYKASL